MTSADGCGNQYVTQDFTRSSLGDNMNEQPIFELRYNLTADGYDAQQGELGELLDASKHLVNPWEIRRPSDNLLVYAETDKMCDCGTGRVMRGWRVCCSCAQSRLMYPGFWADLVPEPDRIEGVEGVPVEFMAWDMSNLRVGRFEHNADAQEAGR